MLLPLNRLPSPSTRPLGKGLTALGVQFCLDWFVNHLYSLQVRSLETPSYGLAFVWVLGIQTQVLLLA